LRPGQDPAIRQQALRLTRAALQKAGFDLEKYAEFKRREIAAVQEALAKLRASANERTPAMRDAVARSTEYWLTVNNALSPGPDVFALSTADHISVDPGFELISENIGPWANSAQVKLDKTSDDDDFFDGRVTFSFSFENQTGAGNYFTVNALLGVTGNADVTADGYLNPDNWIWGLGPPSGSTLSVDGRLGIIEFIDGQVLIPPDQPDQNQSIMELGVAGDFGGRGYHCRSGLVQDVHPLVPRPLRSGEWEGRVRRRMRGQLERNRWGRVPICWPLAMEGK
jgi:hypothetical protein